MLARPVQPGPTGSPDSSRAGAEGPHTRAGQLSDTGHRPPSARPRDEPYAARDTDPYSARWCASQPPWTARECPSTAEEMHSEAGVCRPGGDGACGMWAPGPSVDTRGLWEGREAGVGRGVQTSRVSFLGASRRTQRTCSPSSGRRRCSRLRLSCTEFQELWAGPRGSERGLPRALLLHGVARPAGPRGPAYPRRCACGDGPRVRRCCGAALSRR